MVASISRNLSAKNFICNFLGFRSGVLEPLFFKKCDINVTFKRMEPQALTIKIVCKGLNFT